MGFFVKNRSSTTNNKKFIVNDSQNFDIQPKIIDINYYTNSSGVREEIYKIKFFCLVHVDNINQSKCKKIEGFLTKKSTGELSSNNRRSDFKKIERNAIKNVNLMKRNSKVNKGLGGRSSNIYKGVISNINLSETTSTRSESQKSISTNAYTSILSNQSYNKIKDIKKPLEINSAQNESKKICVFKIPSLKKDFKKIINLTQENTIQNSGNQESNFSTQARFFKENHNKKFIYLGIDPLSIFQKPYNKNSYVRSVRGNQQKGDVNQYFKYYPRAVNLISSVFQEIYYRENEVYKRNITFKEEKFKVLEAECQLTKTELNRFGPSLNFLMIAKNDKGVNIESSTLIFNVDSLIAQSQKDSLEYEIFSTRTQRGENNLQISNLNKNNRLNISLSYKSFRGPHDYALNRFSNDYQDITLKRNEKILVKNGKLRNSSKKNANSDMSIFYRTTLKFANESFDNAISSSSKKTFSNKENIPNAGIVAIQDNQSKSIKITITGLTDNVSSFEIFKRKASTGNSRSSEKKVYTSLSNLVLRKPLGFVSTNKTAGSYVFNDYDVLNEEIYEYFLRCKMKNGEIRIVNNRSIVKAEERTQTVRISNFNIEEIGKSISEEDQSRSSVKVSFNVKKIETEVDKIFKSIYGDVFTLFETELKNISDLKSFTYSVLVERTNKKTGEKVKVGTFEVDDQTGDCVFNDILDFGDYYYTLIPRVALTADIISSVDSLIDRIGKKAGNRKVDFSYATARKKSRNINTKKVSSTSNKFNVYSASKKGRLESPETIINRTNLDFFSDRSTGDLYTFEYNSLPSNTNLSKFDLVSISEIKNMSLSSSQSRNNFNDANIPSKRYFNIHFKVDLSLNNNLDFLAMFIYENDNVYLDGAIHSKDDQGDSIDYKYLATHSGTVGLVSYYVLPVLKDGTILSPYLIGSNLVE